MFGRRETIIIAVTVLFFSGAFAMAQTGYRAVDEMGEMRFDIQTADFRSDKEGFNRLEIYYKVFYNGLSYTRTEKSFEAQYTVSVVVSGKKGIQIEGMSRDGFIQVDTYADTRKPSDFIINMFEIVVPNDEDLSIRAELHDKKAQTSYLVEKKLSNRDYWGKYPSVSRVQFAREVEAAQLESKFDKDSLRIIPSISRLFGGEPDGNMNYYLEIYPGHNGDKYSKLITKVYHRSKGFIYSDTLKLGELDKTRKAAYKIDISNFIPGYYELEIRLEGRRGKLYSKIIEEVELELTAESIFRSDYETAVDMVKFLATRTEHNQLKAADNPEAQEKAWSEFWQKRDQEAHSNENPTKYEYFRRIRHANRYFSIMKREGWKTNRGMVYITYGEPDELEDFPFELSSKPYQIWHYYKSRPPREFLFIDEWGNGDYELQPPYNGIGF